MKDRIDCCSFLAYDLLPLLEWKLPSNSKVEHVARDLRDWVDRDWNEQVARDWTACERGPSHAQISSHDFHIDLVDSKWQ